MAASLIVLMQILHPSRPFFLQGPDNTVAVFFFFCCICSNDDVSPESSIVATRGGTEKGEYVEREGGCSYLCIYRMCVSVCVKPSSLME